MRLARWMLAIFGALAFATGCDSHAGEHYAAEAAQPPMWNPVGPVPGGAKATATPANPYAGDAVAAMRGRQWFKRYNCAGCHGDHAGGGMGPSLRDQAWRYGGTAADIFGSIAQGRQGMPSWGTRLPANQIWELTTYIQTLRTPNEPEPPTP